MDNATRKIIIFMISFPSMQIGSSLIILRFEGSSHKSPASATKRGSRSVGKGKMETSRGMSTHTEVNADDTDVSELFQPLN